MSFKYNQQTDQEGAEHVEGQEVEDSKVGATVVLLPREGLGLGVALLPGHAGHHDLLPPLSSGDPVWQIDNLT